MLIVQIYLRCISAGWASYWYTSSSAWCFTKLAIRASKYLVTSRETKLCICAGYRLQITESRLEKYFSRVPYL